MSKVRDSQRRKLYKAEREAKLDETPLPTVLDCHNYVHKCLKSKRLLKTYPFMRGAKIGIKDGRRTRIARGGRFYLNLPRWARTKWVVLHELAHTITIRGNPRPVPGHGREYAAVFLKLVHLFLGADEAKRLKAAYKANKVKFRPKRAGTPRPKGVMPEGLRKYLEAKRQNERAKVGPLPGVQPEGA